jgi:regulator of replication initiation timing
MRKSLSDLIKILEKNIKDLQEQLQNAYKRIKVLTEENYKLRRKLNIEGDFGHELTKTDGWGEEPVENPDAKHIEKDNDFKTGG